MEREEIEYLYGLRRFGMKLDLSIMREFVALAGNPQDNLRFAHIAGTNGKGSTARFLYAIMRNRYHVGIYTSPHIERFNERIIVDDEEIDDDFIVNFVRKYRGTIDALGKEMRNPTFFEVTTTMALTYFLSKGADFVILEVGLGGRLDATNIVNPDITAITTIDYDHTHILGKSLGKIAREKAGIIKPHVPIVVGERKKAARRVIERIAEERNAPYHNINDECEISDIRVSLDGTEFYLATPVREYRLRAGMIGVHQPLNAAIAVRMAEILSENYEIGRGDIERGVEKAFWRGRMEIKSRDPLLIFDGAHNPSGARVVTKTLRALGLGKWTLLFSMLADKNIKSFLSKFKGVVERVIVSEINYHRRARAEDLARIAGRYFEEVIIERDPCEALAKALEYPRTLATGSIYFLGDLEPCLRSLL